MTSEQSDLHTITHFFYRFPRPPTATNQHMHRFVFIPLRNTNEIQNRQLIHQNNNQFNTKITNSKQKRQLIKKNNQNKNSNQLIQNKNANLKNNN